MRHSALVKGFLIAFGYCAFIVLVFDYIGARNRSSAPNASPPDTVNKRREINKQIHNRAIENEIFLPIVTRKSIGNNGAEDVSVEKLRVHLPFKPNCAALAKEAQRVYDRAYAESQIPSSVKFYGADAYSHLDFRGLMSGKYIEGLHDASDEELEYLNEDKTLWRVTPTTISCIFRNESFVQFDPTGNTMCRDYVIQYKFKERRFGYLPNKRQYCTTGN